MQIQENIALAPYTTFAIGGAARFFVVVKTVDDVRDVLAFAHAQALPVFVLGGGSNLLVPDAGFPGVVIKVEMGGITQEGICVTAGAGESWDGLVAYTVEHGLWGLENLSGIPGTVGGAAVQAIGAYGAAIGQTLSSVEVFDTQDGVQKKLSNTECHFGYRGSVFKEEDGRYVVLSATFELSAQSMPNVSYRDLHTRFGEDHPSLVDIRNAVIEIRNGKFPDISVEGSAGSFFKNPMLPKEQAEALKEKYPDIPLFSMPETSDIKVPLAWLLDKVLALHGAHVGGARVFEKQALVIAAAKGTAARDVKELASLIEKKVFDELKIKIEPEVKIL